MLDSTHSTLLTLMLRLLDACGVWCRLRSSHHQRSRMRRSHYKATTLQPLDTRIRTTVTPALPLTKKGAPAITHKQHQHRQAYYLPPPLLLISATPKEKRKGRKISHFIIDANRSEPERPRAFLPGQTIHPLTKTTQHRKRKILSWQISQRSLK